MKKKQGIPGWVIVVVIIVVVYFIWSFSSFSEINEEANELIEPYMMYDSERTFIAEHLTRDGYEIIGEPHISNYSVNAPFFEWFGIEDDTVCKNEETYCLSDKVGVSVEMKSLGNRDEQIKDTLLIFHVVYPNAFTYRMTIKSPTDTCDYIVFGKTYRDYWAEINKCVPKSKGGYISLSDECFDSEGQLKEEARIRSTGMWEKVTDQIELLKQCS